MQSNKRLSNTPQASDRLQRILITTCNIPQLDLTFYNEFMDYLFHKVVKPNGTVGLLTNSAGKIIRLLKGFVNYQIVKGIIPPIDLKNFKVVEEETDAIYLNEKELAAIYELDLSDDKQLEEIRDVFITGCFTGLRYSDLSTLSPEHIDLDNENINLNSGRYTRL
ncbi:phage integrase SAM-like domain-containing protein [Bacteroides thetaiotaomicron]|nr:phage integrase SAM-like domain-containing protein [Bacteroides thetaiotaomicron]